MVPAHRGGFHASAGGAGSPGLRRGGLRDPGFSRPPPFGSEPTIQPPCPEPLIAQGRRLCPRVWTPGRPAPLGRPRAAPLPCGDPGPPRSPVETPGRPAPLWRPRAAPLPCGDSGPPRSAEETPGRPAPPRKPRAAPLPWRDPGPPRSPGETPGRPAPLGRPRAAPLPWGDPGPPRSPGETPGRPAPLERPRAAPLPWGDSGPPRSAEETPGRPAPLGRLRAAPLRRGNSPPAGSAEETLGVSAPLRKLRLRAPPGGHTRWAGRRLTGSAQSGAAALRLDPAGGAGSHCVAQAGVSGMIVAQGSLDFVGSSDCPISAFQVARTTDTIVNSLGPYTLLTLNLWAHIEDCQVPEPQNTYHCRTGLIVYTSES
ncbi:uncharacterized protein LOC144576818 [Callithrix jacchus]